MSELPADWTPPPRGIVDIRLAAPENGGGILIGCDCGTTTQLVIEDIEHLATPQDMSFCCHGCQSVHWFVASPAARDA